jgi:hypothetical protein
MPTESLTCDGCGQAADPEHIARRLKRLENMTRYRPIHVQTLFLGAASPALDGEYLYSASGEFRGEGLALLRALGIDPTGKSAEVVLSDFQRRGFLLAYVVDCSVQLDDRKAMRGLLEARHGVVAARIRRSLKPRRLALISEALDVFAERLATELPSVEIMEPEKGKSFRPHELAVGALAAVLGATVAPPL